MCVGEDLGRKLAHQFDVGAVSVVEPRDRRVVLGIERGLAQWLDSVLDGAIPGAGDVGGRKADVVETGAAPIEHRTVDRVVFSTDDFKRELVAIGVEERVTQHDEPFRAAVAAVVERGGEVVQLPESEVGGPEALGSGQVWREATRMVERKVATFSAGSTRDVHVEVLDDVDHQAFGRPEAGSDRHRLPVDDERLGLPRRLQARCDQLVVRPVRVVTHERNPLDGVPLLGDVLL